MTLLRERMIAQMKQRGFSKRTHQSYLYAVAELARYHRKPPDALNADDIQSFFEHLVQEKALAPASVRVYLHALRHAYATHQLQAGMPVYQLQQMLGHSNIRSTMRYVHWVHSYREGREGVSDLVSGLGGANEHIG
jgi:site-specific recombinase XerD